MSDPIIMHITDTHLGAQHQDFEPNFNQILMEIDRIQPDIVINTGDITINGADSVEDHLHARKLHDMISVPWRVLPGNHDIGDNPSHSQHIPKQFPNIERQSRFLEIWGYDRWALDLGKYRLIGLNAQLCGTGGESEKRQLDFLREEIKILGDRPIALFLHKPLFMKDSEETAFTSRCIPPPQRAEFLELLGSKNLKLIASGHMHQYYIREINGVTHAWGPSSAYILPEGFQPSIGNKEIGYILYHLQENNIESEVIVPEGMEQSNLLDFPAPYGSLRPYIEGKKIYVS